MHLREPHEHLIPYTGYRLDYPAELEPGVAVTALYSAPDDAKLLHAAERQGSTHVYVVRREPGLVTALLGKATWPS